MEFTQSFLVPVSKEEAFVVLTDIERVAPCMPGATLDRAEDDRFFGQVRVKVGPMRMAFAGEARFLQLSPELNTVTIEATGQEVGGAGRATAIIEATLADHGSDTEVSVHTHLDVTGRAAQFGQGVMAEIGGKLLGQFADCLASQLRGDVAAGTDQASVGGSGTADSNELDAWAVIRGPVLRRVAASLTGVAALALLWRLAGRWFRPSS